MFAQPRRSRLYGGGFHVVGARPVPVARVSAYGKYTFGIYMYQWLFILVCQQYLRPWHNGILGGIALIIACYATCVAAAVCSYRFFETPVNTFIRPAIAAYARKRVSEAQS